MKKIRVFTVVKDSLCDRCINAFATYMIWMELPIHDENFKNRAYFRTTGKHILTLLREENVKNK